MTALHSTARNTRGAHEHPSTRVESVRRVQCHIVDADSLTRHLLADALTRQDGVTVVGRSGDESEAAASLVQHRPDLLFLSARLDARTLRAFLKYCECGSPAVVLISPVAADACAAFACGAMDFLHLPAPHHRVAAVISRIRRHLAECEMLEWARETLRDPGHATEAAERRDAAAPSDEHTSIAIPTVGGTELLRIASIEAIVSHRTHITVFTTGGSVAGTGTLVALWDRLAGENFLWTHRSAVANMSNVRRVLGNCVEGGRLVLSSGTAIPVSRRRFAEVKRALLASRHA